MKAIALVGVLALTGCAALQAAAAGSAWTLSVSLTVHPADALDGGSATPAMLRRDALDAGAGPVTATATATATLVGAR